MKRFSLQYLFSLLFVQALILSNLFLAGSIYAQQDLMEQAFTPSKSHEQIVDLGNNKMAVGNEVFHDSQSASWTKEDGFSTEKKESLIVRATKLFLRITIAVAIPMVIFNGIRLIYYGVTGAITAALKALGYIALGIVIILSSVAIIYLVQSATVSTILERFSGS